MQIEQVRTKLHTNDNNNNDNTYIVIGIEGQDDAVVVAGNWKKIYNVSMKRNNILFYRKRRSIFVIAISLLLLLA